MSGNLRDFFVTKFNVIKYHDTALDKDVLKQLVLDYYYIIMKTIEIRSPDCFLKLKWLTQFRARSILHHFRS